MRSILSSWIDCLGVVGIRIHGLKDFEGYISFRRLATTLVHLNLWQRGEQGKALRDREVL